ncbi:S8 family peptidase [Colwellia sp. C1TZA3]|uniref:S8 family peptidase n=1 Tax=Colwellia sp. C1TZA3 TaxID=2508879 RepID=UPI0011BA14BA|nr:S8 family serine peptidase [Colwellia sp. C1TZA3]TWX72775.1 S8 family serine peptidase [Colwellia sp. C1TZA3]
MKSIIKNMALTMSIAGISLSATAAAVIGSQLEQKLQNMTATDRVMVVVSYDQLDALTTTQLQSLLNFGLTQGVQFKSLPIIGVMASPGQINQLAVMPGIRSVFANRSLEYYNAEAREITGVEKLQSSAFENNNGMKFTGKGVTVIVNDSGIDATLDDLEYGTKVVENVQGITHAQALSLTGVDGVWIEGQPNTDLNVGHGTHCAGTVGGWGTRSDGKYKGAAPGADIVGYGSGAGLSILDALGGYDYAISNVWAFNSPIRVMSNSWGSSGKYDPAGPISLASYKAHRLDIISVFAAGNSGSGEDTHNPYAQIPWGLSVGASTKQGDLIDFSSRGKRGETDDFTMPDGSPWTYKNEVTIVAPGVDIISTRAKTNVASNGGANDVGVIENEYLPFYTRISGTSMAAPHVAGIVALMLEANPDLTNLQIKTIIQATATNMPGYQSWEVGAGHVNAYAAVAGALAYDEQNSVTVNNLNTFNANAIVIDDDAPEPFSVLFTPVGEPEVHLFNVADDAAWISASSETLANLVKLKLEAPDGTIYLGNLTTPVLSSTMRVSAPAQAGEWKLSAFGITSLSGVQADPTGTTNGPGIPEFIEGDISILTSGGYDGLNDIAGHPAEKAIEFAVSERLIDSKGDKTYRPSADLKRQDLAQFLVMGMSIRQHRDLLNEQKTVFTDVRSQHAPFVDAVTTIGSALKDSVQNQFPVILSHGSEFSPHHNVSKQALAYSLVQSLGLETQALDFSGELTVDYNGERIAVIDSSAVTPVLKGYVQAAIDMSLMRVRFALEQGPYGLSPTVVAYFEPKNNIKRGDYAVIIGRVYDGYLR